jgi:nitric oxide reductase subunit C
VSAPTPWWASDRFWRNCAVFVTAASLLLLIILTFDTLAQTSAGRGRVPGYDVINYRIDYVPDADGNRYRPVIGPEAPLFGKKLDDDQARALVDHVKKLFQGRNCINCHTILGNGAYYAPDLTKAWLDPAWGHEGARETLMLMFLMDPVANARGFGTQRRMPDLNLTEDEARALIAYLKWVSAIDTNGFPHNFPVIPQGGP